MQPSPIQWTDSTCTLLGCRRVSEGCRNCYAERLIATRMSKNPKLPMYHGIAELTVKGEPRFTGEHRLLPDRLDEPLRTRKGRKIFVCDMGDLFFDGHTFEEIAAVWGVMAAAGHHTFQVLTKRPERALEFLTWLGADDAYRLRAIGEDIAARMQWCHAGEDDWRWPLPNVHVGVSVEDQASADKRIPLLLQIPAALRFLSMEPLLGEVRVLRHLMGGKDPGRCLSCGHGHGFTRCQNYGGVSPTATLPGGAMCTTFRRANHEIAWVIVGGESGPHARPFDLAWARSIRDQCRAAGVPVFVKQLGARPFVDIGTAPGDPERCGEVKVHLKDKHGGNMAEWPEDLRIRETPAPAGEPQ